MFEDRYKKHEYMWNRDPITFFNLISYSFLIWILALTQ